MFARLNIFSVQSHSHLRSKITSLFYLPSLAKLRSRLFLSGFGYDSACWKPKRSAGALLDVMQPKGQPVAESYCLDVCFGITRPTLQ